MAEIQQVAQEELEEVNEAEQEKIPEVPDADMGLPDGDKLVDLTRESATETSMPTETFPRTLSQALSGDRSFWGGLWQLAVFMRCGKDGMDSKFLKKAEVIRRRSSKMNWQQQLGFIECIGGGYWVLMGFV